MGVEQICRAGSASEKQSDVASGHGIYIQLQIPLHHNDLRLFQIPENNKQFVNFSPPLSIHLCANGGTFVLKKSDKQ